MFINAIFLPVMKEWRKSTTITILLFVVGIEFSKAFSARSVSSLSSPALSPSCCYDVIIVGGSTAGLSAALSLGRSFRDVLVIDSDEPCNRPQTNAHNLLGYDGVPPDQLKACSRSDVEAYDSITFLSGHAVDIQLESAMAVSVGCLPLKEKNHSHPGINNEIGESLVWVQGRKLLMATGVHDCLPIEKIEGIQECWGKTAIHCPYCHGYEFASRRTALLGMKPSTIITMAQILKKFTPYLFVIIGSDKDCLSVDQREQLQKNGIKMIELEVVSLRHSNGILHSLVFDDGSSMGMDVVYIRPPFSHRFPEEKLLELSPDLLNDEGYIEVDRETQKTSLPDIFACGDCTDSNRSLSIALGSGTRAAKRINYELALEDWEAI